MEKKHIEEENQENGGGRKLTDLKISKLLEFKELVDKYYGEQVF